MKTANDSRSDRLMTQRNTVERPPSTPMTWPVIHAALSESKKAARLAESWLGSGLA